MRETKTLTYMGYEPKSGYVRTGNGGVRNGSRQMIIASFLST